MKKYMKLDDVFEQIKKLKQKENDLYVARSGMSSAYAMASYREQDQLDRVDEIYDEKIKAVRDQIDELKAKI